MWADLEAEKFQHGLFSSPAGLTTSSVLLKREFVSYLCLQEQTHPVSKALNEVKDFKVEERIYGDRIMVRLLSATFLRN